jgi:hypothetical protein
MTEAQTQTLDRGDLVKLKDPYQGRYSYGVVMLR